MFLGSFWRVSPYLGELVVADCSQPVDLRHDTNPFTGATALVPQFPPRGVLGAPRSAKGIIVLPTSPESGANIAPIGL